jgi:hypothetical protein
MIKKKLFDVKTEKFGGFETVFVLEFNKLSPHKYAYEILTDKKGDVIGFKGYIKKETAKKLSRKILKTLGEK